MAYTGTGTEQDPYLVNNLTDFLSAVKQDHKYVKIVSDIDAFDDENYTGTLGEVSIEVKATKIYADKPVKISGITTEALHFFDFTSSASGVEDSITIENVKFIDCALKPLGLNANQATMLYGNYKNTVYVKNCAFKINFICNNGLDFLGFLVDLYSCKMLLSSLDIAFTMSDRGVSTNVMLFKGTSLDRCNVIIRCFAVRFVDNYSGSFILAGDADHAVTNTTFVLTGYRTYPNTNIQRGIRLYNCSNCYLAFVDSGDTGSPNWYISNERCTNTLLCFENTTINDNRIGGSWTRVTPEQLRDKDYLLSINFLP